MKKRIYIFLRKDLDPVQRIIQAAHAALDAGKRFKLSEERYKIIIFGIRSEMKLLDIMEELHNLNVLHVIFKEPDMNNSITAIATEPLYEDSSKIFKRFKLLEPS